MVSNTPHFDSNAEYINHKANVALWQPFIKSVLKRHKLMHHFTTIIPGFNSTNPVFICNDIVIKFFGHRPNWQTTYNNELAIYKHLTCNPNICAPTYIISDQLDNNKKNCWPYIISSKITGKTWLNSTLTKQQQQTIVSELGKQLHYLHNLPVDDSLPSDQSWPTLDLETAAQHSSLPQHLINQINPFISKLDRFDRVLTNGDIVSMHVFINNDHLSGIIDWGDAVVTDRHYDIGKLVLSLFPGNKSLLNTLLKTSNWPIKQNFPKQTLGLALYRQAVGLTQHHSFDIFYQLSDIFPMNQAKSLDELADWLFKV